MQPNFIDTILNIAVTGNLVRIDLGVLAPVAKQGEQSKEVRAIVTQQLVMPLEGFVRSFGIQDQVMAKLIADGVVKAKPEAAQARNASAVEVKTGSAAKP